MRPGASSQALLVVAYEERGGGEPLEVVGVEWCLRIGSRESDIGVEPRLSLERLPRALDGCVLVDGNLLSPYARCGARSTQHAAQRVAPIGIAERHFGHGRVVGVAAGALNRFACFTTRKIANAMIRKFTTSLRKAP